MIFLKLCLMGTLYEKAYKAYSLNKLSMLHSLSEETEISIVLGHK